MPSRPPHQVYLYALEYGYPILIDADLVFMAIDEERVIEVLEFEVLDD